MADFESMMVPDGYHVQGCGYCGSRAAKKETSANYYASSDQMLPVHYQGLADRGWRRSGSTYYKPDLKNSCCPHYTIRLDAMAFKPSTNQRKAVNAWNKWIIGQDYKSKTARLSPRSRTEKRFRKQNFDLCQVIHEAEYERLKKPVDWKSRLPTEPAHKFEVTLEADKYTDEKYALYENYQRIVHQESPSKITKPAFRRFLCSGFPQSKDEKGKRLGSHHQCYWLDGKLVAFGVLDLLPQAVSSVYLIYHECVNHWQLGKISALQEIALAKEGAYNYYYMGYYIHSCTKMRYKGDYKPTYVLDPETYDWHLFDQSFRDSLDCSKYVTYSGDRWQPQTPGAASDEKGHPGNIWEASMAGVPTPEEILGKLSTSELKANLGGLEFSLDKLIGTWDLAKILSGRSLQSVLVEWAACVGVDLATKITLQLTPYLS